jgi:hypothetical protein
MPPHGRKTEHWLTVQGPRLWYRAAVQLDPQDSSNLSATLGKIWQEYDVARAYDHARRKHNPLLSPHGMFRELRQGCAADAQKFLQTFGPLALTPPARAPLGFQSVPLDIFWSRQLRFRLVAGLWDGRADKRALLGAWRAIAENHASASLHQKLPFGFPEEPGLPRDNPPFPWNLNRMPFDRWEREVDYVDAKKHALALIRLELEIHTADCTIAWENGWEATKEKFRPILRPPSLLAMMWELFGLDTLGIGWRRCTHCRKLIYPKRCDQFYCTVRQQALASKRNYAANRRAEAQRAAARGKK